MISNWLPFRSAQSSKASRVRLPDARAIRQIREATAQLESLSDAEMARYASDLREASDLSIDAGQLTVEAFALATEAVRRTTGKTYYDVQLQAGHVLANGHLAEMQTGEGKTLVTLLPVIHAAIANHKVHVATTNDYLAERDCAEVQPALELLGFSMGLLPEDNNDDLKRAAYDCDVTYGTGYEYGFDYLRDQLTLRKHPVDRLGETWLRELAEREKPMPQLVQSAREVSIVDEIDSVLIDEANTPLVISFFTDDVADVEPYRHAAAVASKLEETVDYRVDAASNRLTMTRLGQDRIQQAGSSKAALQRPWRIYVEQALRAQHLLRRDVDYVIQENAVALVDQQTGRIFPERKWRDGLHQAIEFREGVELTAETNSFARISRQRFFQLYGSGTGMTGTAMDAVTEFRAFFSLGVVPIPLNCPSQRAVLPMRYFADFEAKYRAIIAETVARHVKRQPVLIGTRTIEQSQAISALLREVKVPHQTLDGTQDGDEAEIVGLAGHPGAVTVATNMAGRGTDIKLTKQSREDGGLHVIIAELNRSRRVDRQLMGRCGRQGDPGSCQFFVSADDEIIEHAGAALAKRIRNRAKKTGEAKMSHDAELFAVQKRIEQTDFQRRQHLMQQEMWVDGMLQTLVSEGAIE